MSNFTIEDIPKIAPAPPEPQIAPETPAPPAMPVTGIPQSTANPLLDVFGQPDYRDDYQKAMDTWRQESATALDAAVLDPKSYADERIPGGWTPDEWRGTRIVDDWMRLHSDGEEPPIGPTREFTRALLAERHFGGAGAESDEALLAQVVAQSTQRRDGAQLNRDIASAAFDDAMLPTDKAGGYAAFREKMKAHPGYRPEQEPDYAEAWQRTRGAAADLVDEYREPLVSVWRAFKMDGNVTAAAYDAWSQLTPEQRPEFLDALAIRAKALPDAERKTFWANMGKQTELAITDYGRKAAESFQSNAFVTTGSSVSTTGAAVPGMSAERIIQGNDERSAAKADFQSRRNFAADVRKIAREDYDPLQSAFGEGGKPGFLENVAYQAPGVTGISLTMALPGVGLGMMAFSMEGQAYETLRGRMLAGGSDDATATANASALAPFVALPQVALEKVGFALWSRKLPLFSKALDALGDKVANRALRFGMKVGTIATAETGIELLQDATNYAVQDLAAALSMDVPDVDWEKELAGTWATAPETFAVMLPLAMLGAAGGLSQESRQAAFRSASTTEKQALGMTADGIAAIEGAQGPAALNAAIEAAWTTRDPNSAEAAAAVAQLKAQQAAQRSATEQLEQLGYAAPSFVQSTDGIFVFDGDGKELGQAPDLSGALRIAKAHTTALDNLEADQIAALGSLMEAAKAAVTLDPQSTVEVNLGQFNPEQASPEMAARFAAQVALKEQAEGGTGDIARSVLGYSVTSFAQGLRETVNKLFGGAAVTDVFHETFHGLRRQALKAGTITRADEIALLRALDTIFQGKRTKDGVQLRFIPENTTDDQVSETLLDEAFSEIAEMELLRTRKGKGKGKLGLTRGVISRNLSALAKLIPGVAGKWQAFMAAVRVRWGLSLSRAIAMKKAERDGTFDKEGYDAYLDKLLGLDQQTEHDAGVQSEFDRILGLPDELADDDIPFSIGRSTVTPTPATRVFQGGEGSPSVIGPAAFSIGAFHGTPHRVGRFSTDKIGSGEGAQAFGWGLYFAKAKAVAEEYRKILGSEFRMDGEIFLKGGNFGPAHRRIYDDLGEEAADILVAFIDQGKARVIDELNNPLNQIDQDTFDRAADFLDRIEATNSGNLYTVTLKVEDEDLLDWDKPLSEQSEKVQSAARQHFEKRGFNLNAAMKMSGAEFYGYAVSSQQQNDGDAARQGSEYLFASGIPGIRFLDGTSRMMGGGKYNVRWEGNDPINGTRAEVYEMDSGKVVQTFDTFKEADQWVADNKPEGSYNYVIFDDADIEIVEENGTPVDIGEEPAFSIGSVHPELKTTAAGDALPKNVGNLAGVSDATSSKLIDQQFVNLDAIFTAIPNPLATAGMWVTFMRALGKSLGKKTAVPIAPERAIGYANGQGFDHIMVDLKQHPEYVAARVQGLAVGTQILEKFRDGSLKRADLGSLFIWGLLSRGIGAYPQEGAFSAIHRAGLIEKLEAVFQGQMTPEQLRDWALESAAGSPIGGAFRNVKAIDKMVTAMLFEIDGKPAIDHLLDLWKSDLSGPQLRREVYRMFTNDRPSIQIQNKVLSFIILVSGRPDVMVLDRVQFRHLWGGATLEGIIEALAAKLQVAKDATLKLREITKGSAKELATQDVNTDASNTYDALPVVVSKAEENRTIEGQAELKAFGQFWAVVLNFAKVKRAGTFDFQKVGGKLKVKRTGLVGLGNGLHGLASYEAIERALAAPVKQAYADAGIDFPGLGAFHWDSWLVSSRQAISHPTLDLIAGNQSPSLAVMEGKFNTINYGILYRYDGQYMREFLTVPGRYVMLTPEAAAKEYTTKAVNKAIGRKGKNQLKLKKSEELEDDEDGPQERTRPWTEDLSDAERLAFDRWLNTIGTSIEPDPADGADGRADGGGEAGLEDLQDGAVDSAVDEADPAFSIGGVKAANWAKYQSQGRAFTGADGKPRFEMDASQAAFMPSGINDPAQRNGFKRLGADSPIRWLVPEGMDTPLGNLIAFDELFENYPQLAGLKVRLKTLPTGTHGRFARVEINGKVSLEFSNIDLSDRLKAGAALNVLLHEVQHTIQDIEGFAQGGSPEQFQEYDEAGLKLENNKYAAALRALIEDYEAKGGTAKDAMQSEYGKVLGDSLMKIQDALREPARKYRALPGEKEARGVQARQSMTAEQRAASPFMDNWGSFSIGPAQVADVMAGNALARITDPRRRTQVMSRIARDFNAMRLQIDRMATLSGFRRSKSDMRAEAMARQELRAEELIADVHRRFGEIMADDDLVKIKAQPVHAFLSDPSSPLRGRLKSKAAAIREHPDMFQLHRAGDYDGSDGVSRSVFGGTRMPDQAAQELYDNGLIPEPTADAMWEALMSEQKTVAGMKELLERAKVQIREAKAQAKQEATEWLATQGKDQEVNFSDKEEIRRSLRMLDAILLALPPEIRGKIGGYTQMSMITTDAARLAYLKDKLAKADKELETFLRIQYAAEWEALLKKAAPAQNESGQRPTGSIAADAYDIFRIAEAAMGMSFAVGEAEADKWDAIADHPDTEAKDADIARVNAQMIRLTMNWTAADAARREQAVLEGEKIYFDGLAALRKEASRRRERLGQLRDSAITGTRKSGSRMEREAAIRAAKGNKGREALQMAWEFLSFGQVVNVLFGEASAAARWFNARELAASNAFEDAFQAKANAIEALFVTLAGSRFQGEVLKNKMTTDLTIKVKDALGIEHEFSDSQAITFLLMWRQEDGQRHMRGLVDEETQAIISQWAWNDASAAAIEAQLSPAGHAAMAFLGQSYGEEYGRINAVFRRIWNVSMPRHKMYSPLSVAPAQGKADTIMDPVSGDTMGAGMTPGSLKNRSFSAIAEPLFKDAFQVYVSHARQMEHFIAYGEFSRDSLAIVNRREARNAIEAAGGPFAAGVLSKWLDFFAVGGVKDANMGGAVARTVGGAIGRLSQAALVGRVSVLAMQSLQLVAASYQMPVGAFLTRLAKLKFGRLAWGAAVNSEYIQRRIAIMPPIVRDAVQGLASGTPNRAKYYAAELGKTISGADALFTGGTYAIFYDYHLKLAKASRIPKPEAHAHSEAERLTDQVAQPVRIGARSWLEVANQGNPAFRAMWNFSSDPRQKVALLVYAAMRRDTSAPEKTVAVGKALIITWLGSGVLAALLRAAIRDLRDDDDDEWFDERHWSAKRLGLMALTGPLGGMPYFGEIMENTSYKATGEYMPAGGMLAGIGQSIGLVPKWLDGDFDLLKDAEQILTDGAAASSTSAALASAMHILRDAWGVLENLEGPDPD